jgi:hypothetical protein
LTSNWRKSSYSGGQGGTCVEVGTAARMVAVRDTKDNGTGPVLRVSSADWSRFTKALKH